MISGMLKDPRLVSVLAKVTEVNGVDETMPSNTKVTVSYAALPVDATPPAASSV